ncbi:MULTISPECIES: hypothetical protein [Alishewanella]|jgi:hypothetical protein|uniref:Uncharacterized protein n=2 Tax=Alishewanella TaxID=111142 RepID=H3ZDR3_9ALTE|nr:MULTISPECIES: hypothetical protein [Alishewanella]EHR41294.1 hypothetical protein AJE_07441 [Alishewanella jeotgali KCTC 22429]EJI86798.1 hypothetical protein AEST_03440 [Alishewanella aestuarii B11]MCT8127377.1 hypothetical protein [Alishewanella sp. BS5-314]OCW96380.1 hypothetical protein A9165_11795 [Alishewanella sp. HH-ZS]
MDMFLSFITLFLVANMAIVFTLLRRVDLNNASVQAWEQQQLAHSTQATQAVYAQGMNTELAQ